MEATYAEVQLPRYRRAFTLGTELNSEKVGAGSSGKTGPLIEWYGLSSAGLAAVPVSLVPLLMVLAVRTEQRSARRRSAVSSPGTRSA